MDISKNLKYHINIFKTCGFWEMESYPSIFRIYSVSLFTILLIIFPASLILNIFYVDTIEAVIRHSFITVSACTVSIKALVVILKRHRIKELMQIMKDIDLGSQHLERDSMLRKTCGDCQRLICAILIGFMATFTSLVIQTILSIPEERMWPSTTFIPIESLHHPVIYNAVLIYQALANAVMGIMGSALDTYSVVLMHSLRCLLHILGIRLRQIGHRIPSIDDERELIAVCKEYEKFLR